MAKLYHSIVWSCNFFKIGTGADANTVLVEKIVDKVVLSSRLCFLINESKIYGSHDVHRTGSMVITKLFTRFFNHLVCFLQSYAAIKLKIFLIII